MIERLGFPKLLINPPNPALGIKEIARLDCGCQVMVGMRLDNHEVATLAAPCADEHIPLVQHFNLLLAESTASPENTDLVIVVDRLLGEAERWYLP